MAAKINISVPDELQKRITDLGISPSKLYQDAAKARADREEALQKARNEEMPKGEEMENIVERLRKEKEELVGQHEKWGNMEGVNFAKTYDYEALKDAVDLAQKVTAFYKENDYIPWDMVGKYHKNDDVYTYLIENAFEGYNIESNKDDTNSLKEGSAKWILGWCNGVLKFWNELPEDLRK